MTESPHVTERLAVYRVADVQLRGRGGPLPARAYWPAPSEPTVSPALLVLFPDVRLTGARERADALGRALCSHVGVVVLSATCRLTTQGVDAAALEDAITATDWAADHATELGADPRRLVVAGVAVGAHLAAAVALHARDNGWPAITRQVLVRPDLSMLGAQSPDGVAGATVVTVDDAPSDHGRRYAALLRDAGVEVDELRLDGVPDEMPSSVPGDLARSLRRNLQSPPDRPVTHGRAPR